MTPRSDRAAPRRKNAGRTSTTVFGIGLLLALLLSLLATSVDLFAYFPKPSSISQEALSYFSATPFVNWSTLPPKRGHGVVYSAYSFDQTKSLPIFLDEAAKSAQQLKSNNPEVPVAILTNAKSGVPPIFDFVIPVDDSMLFSAESTRPDGIYRQWFTRIWYLAHSPFEVTWSLDSHAVVPTKTLSSALQEFADSDFDIATANQKNSGFYCHNFSILFRWNDKVQTLFMDWILRQIQRGLSTDDQGPLAQALACNTYGLKYGALSPQWSLAFLSVKWGENREFWRHRTTRVLTGAPQICHKDDVCSIQSEHEDRPRILYLDSASGSGSARVFYDESSLQEVLPFSFNWPEWKHPQTKLVEEKSIKCQSPKTIGAISKGQDNQIFAVDDLEACRNSLVTKPAVNAYGAWTYCESTLSSNPTVISFGIGTNMDWERHMIESHGATVYAHDPTPKSIQFVQSKLQEWESLRTPNFVFKDVGVGASDLSNVTLHLPSNPNFVSARVGEAQEGSKGSVQVELWSMPKTFREHGLESVDIVKWDVEGVEFDVIESLDELPTKLLLLEWHTRFQDDPQRQKKATQQLNNLGFVLVHTSPNKEEEVFFNSGYVQ